MATQEEKIALVREGRTEFEQAETRLQADMAGMDALVDIFTRGVTMDMVNGRRGTRLIARAMKIKAALADISADVHELHADSTQIARDNNADEEIPGGFVVFGGGSRG